MARTSRLPGFYKISDDERRALVGDTTGTGPDEVANALDHGGLDAETADKFVENVIGTYSLFSGSVGTSGTDLSAATVRAVAKKFTDNGVRPG